MQYRSFGRVSRAISALGFGCMRLPTNDGNPLSGDLNEAESIRMIRHAIDHGVNYLDTAYPYHMGNSEIVLGKALLDGYREQVLVATKSPMFSIQKADDFDRILNEQLVKLQTDRIDCYLLHGLDKRKWDNTVLKLDILQRAEKAKVDGKIGSLGFSFHDSFEAFEQIVGGYDGWDFCQIQYNYMDIENQAGLKGLRCASSRGLGVVVMEPLLGGRLAQPPEAVRTLFATHSKQHSPAEWALQWLWNQPEVSVVLSGMSTFKQVEYNLESAARSATPSLTTDDLALIDRVRAKYREKTPIPCTRCGYCMPCPTGLNIPRNFELYNDGFIYANADPPRMFYSRFMPQPERAAECVECNDCVDKCPQKIPIPTWMPTVHSVLGERQPYPA